MAEDKGLFSDDDVICSVRDGKTQNFEIIINRYSKKIINFIFSMISDYDEAQSLSQDVFLKVYESLKRYKTENNFQSFIFTVAKNLTLNYLKKQKKVLSFSFFSSDDKRQDPLYTEERQHLILEKNQDDEMLTTALKNLKENQRLALIMKVYLDFSYKRIAEITGWSIPKIETLISRAKSSLKSTLLSGDNLQENKNINVLKVRHT
jgi:RNA polymerase sigma-70 factor (ECF subfamily)